MMSKGQSLGSYLRGTVQAILVLAQAYEPLKNKMSYTQEVEQSSMIKTEIDLELSQK